MKDPAENQAESKPAENQAESRSRIPGASIRKTARPVPAEAAQTALDEANRELALIKGEKERLTKALLAARNDNEALTVKLEALKVKLEAAQGHLGEKDAQITGLRQGMADREAKINEAEARAQHLDERAKHLNVQLRDALALAKRTQFGKDSAETALREQVVRLVRAQEDADYESEKARDAYTEHRDRKPPVGRRSRWGRRGARLEGMAIASEANVGRLAAAVADARDAAGEHYDRLDPETGQDEVMAGPE